MRTISADLLAHIRGDGTSLAFCWNIEKRNGVFIRGTDHDEDIPVPAEDSADDGAGIYLAGTNINASDARSTSDTSVDNMDVSGASVPSTDLTDISVADMEAGLLDGAAVEIFIVNWRDPGMGRIPYKCGYLGELSRDSDKHYTTELRGIKQLLQQVFVRTYSERCQVKRFGDAECGFDLSSATYSGTVTEAINAKRFNSTITDLDSSAVGDYFDDGELTFLTGSNAGYMREVKRGDYDDTVGHFGTWDRFPNDPEIGDTFIITPGCNRLPETCKFYGRFTTGWRGYGLWIPGIDDLTKGPL